MANATDLIEPKNASSKNGKQGKNAKKKNPNMKGGWGGKRVAGQTMNGEPSTPQRRYGPKPGFKHQKSWSRVPKHLQDKSGKKKQPHQPHNGAAYLTPGMYFTKVTQVGNEFNLRFTAVPSE